jgi:sulfur-oxidizing protein SoxX
MRIRRALAVVLLGALYFPLAFSQSIEQGVIVQSLTDVPGDPVRGRAIVTSRQTGLCLLCHSGPFPEERFQGNLAPELASSVGRYSAAQLRARIVDASYFNANTIMPAYFRTDHLHRVASKFSGQTILNGQEIEDVVAFLLTLNSGVQ